MLLRLMPTLLLQLLALAIGWDLLIALLGQGARFVVAGWWASLLGLVMIGMALLIPLVGLLAGLLPSLLLRLPQPMDEGDFALAATGIGLLHAASYLGLGLVLMRLWPPRASPNAIYDGHFLLVAAFVAGGFGLLSAFGSGAIVARRPIRLSW